LRVRSAARTVVPPFAGDIATGGHDERADHRIGRDVPPPALREFERLGHVRLVSFHPRLPPGARTARSAAVGRRRRSTACFLPSRLSRSVPGSHRVHPRVARAGSRTVTAGGELRPAPETGFSPRSIRRAVDLSPATVRGEARTRYVSVRRSTA